MTENRNKHNVALFDPNGKERFSLPFVHEQSNLPFHSLTCARVLNYGY